MKGLKYNSDEGYAIGGIGMNELISIMIPVYNVKAYLEKAVYSVINQTYKAIEIFWVDDGSTDGSGELCDELAKTDVRIKVFHKDNEGAVSARKVGIANASGLYVLCVDSDDWIEKDCFDKFL